MDNFMYGRTYQISIGTRQSTALQTIVQIEPQHHIEVDFKDSIPNHGSSFNVCTVNLYNIGYDNIALLSQKNLTIVIKADYQYRGNLVITPQQAQIVYVGDIIAVHHDNTGTDVITTLSCQEGFHSAVKEQLLDDVYIPSGSLLRDAFQRVLSFIPYASEIRYQGSSVIKVKKGITLSKGTLIKSLDYLCEKGSQPDNNIQLTWMFHRDKILILDRRPKQVSRRFLKHNISRSVIKGTVEVGFDETTVTPQTAMTGITEVKLRTFLLPQISIGDNIVIESDSGIGNINQNNSIGNREFAVVSIGCSLGYDGGDWDTLITGRVIE